MKNEDIASQLENLTKKKEVSKVVTKTKSGKTTIAISDELKDILLSLLLTKQINEQIPSVTHNEIVKEGLELLSALYKKKYGQLLEAKKIK